MCRNKIILASLRRLTIIARLLAVGGLLITYQPAYADSGPTVIGDVCMQQVYGGDNVTNANRLNCTASDIKIAEAISAVNVATGQSSCIVGTLFDLRATFRVDVTANERYDAAFFFNIAGGADARNVNGTCSESILRNPTQADSNSPVANIDKDSCGDLNAGSYANITFTIPGVLCQDTNGDNLLNLPNCTSWHSNQGSVCTGPSTAAPETKSKCNCDDTFQVPVTVEHPNIGVVKDASPTSLDEPGGSVTFTVKVSNPATSTSITLISLVDDPDNNPATINNVTFDANSNPTLASICGSTQLAPCGPNPNSCAPASSTTCTFTRTISGNAGDSIVDKACVSGIDSNNGAVGPTCDTASVTIKDVTPTATVVKSVEGVVCAELRFKVKVTNTDAAEDLTLSALVDDKFGNIATGQGQPPLGTDVTGTDCALPATIKPGNTNAFVCTFDANVCNFPHKNTVTGTLRDNDQNTISPTGDATATSVTVQ
jgi:hypothetical protein